MKRDLCSENLTGHTAVINYNVRGVLRINISFSCFSNWATDTSQLVRLSSFVCILQEGCIGESVMFSVGARTTDNKVFPSQVRACVASTDAHTVCCLLCEH